MEISNKNELKDLITLRNRLLIDIENCKDDETEEIIPELEVILADLDKKINTLKNNQKNNKV
ncbi:MAG: hypothetical protein V1904_14080 [Bacteroidota bacterium]